MHSDSIPGTQHCYKWIWKSRREQSWVLRKWLKIREHSDSVYSGLVCGQSFQDKELKGMALSLCLHYFIHLQRLCIALKNKSKLLALFSSHSNRSSPKRPQGLGGWYQEQSGSLGTWLPGNPTAVEREQPPVHLTIISCKNESPGTPFSFKRGKSGFWHKVPSFLLCEIK